jgi:hypothetical protein
MSTTIYMKRISLVSLSSVTGGVNSGVCTVNNKTGEPINVQPDFAGHSMHANGPAVPLTASGAGSSGTIPAGPFDVHGHGGYCNPGETYNVNRGDDGYSFQQ